MKLSDLDTSQQLILIRNGKGGKSRVIPATAALLRDLTDLGRTSQSDFVFEGRDANHVSARQVNRIVAQAGTRAGVRNPHPDRNQVTCHLLRHTFARVWKQKQGSIESLSKILGHASVKTTWDQYGTEGLSDVQDNYRKMMKNFGISQPDEEEKNESQS